MSKEKGPNGWPWCPRGLHEMLESNGGDGVTGKGRCRACKRWNDQRDEDKKAGRPLRNDSVTGTAYADLATPAGAAAAAERAQTKVWYAHAKLTSASRDPLAGAVAPPAPAPEPEPVSAAMPVAPPLPQPARSDDDDVPDDPGQLYVPEVIKQAGYWSRELAGMPDIHALRKARANKHNAVVYGPPGTGKTALIETAFSCEAVLNGMAERDDGHECSDCAEVLHGDGDTLVSDFVGGWEPTEREGVYDWCDGPLTRALRMGRPFFIDDFTVIPGKVLAVVYPVLDGRGLIKAKGHTVDLPNGKRGLEVVRAQPGFYVIGGHNPKVHGTLFPEALRSRFTMHVHVPTEYELARAMGIDEEIVKLAENMASMKAAGTAVDWVPEFRDMLNYMRMKRTFGPEAALANLVGLCPDEDQYLLRERIKACFSGQEVTALRVGGRWDS